MCKNRRFQRLAIEQSKHECEFVFAAYEFGNDLTHIVRVYNGSLAILYNVNNRGEVSHVEHKACEDRPSVGFITKLFGFNDRDMRETYRVVAC